MVKWVLLLMLFCNVSFACDVDRVVVGLSERAIRDQELRKKLIENETKENIEMVLEDSERNMNWMRGVIEQCGWPFVSIFGDEASRHAWLLVQHADMHPDFQIYAAEHMKRAVLLGEASGRSLALLVDRVSFVHGKPQVYGMQFREDGNGNIYFIDIDKPEEIDERRIEIGLSVFFCWAKRISEDSGKGIVWPQGVIFLPRDCRG